MRSSENAHLRDIEEECRRSIDIIVHLVRIDADASLERSSRLAKETVSASTDNYAAVLTP